MEDPETGDVVCRNCGMVLEERTVRGGPERHIVEEGKGALEGVRVGPRLTVRRPDFGLATAIGRERGAEKLRRWERRTYYTPSQRSLMNGIRRIEVVASKLDIGANAIDMAIHFYRKAAKAAFLKGRSKKIVSAAAVYLSCREYEIPRTLDAVAQAAGIERQQLARDYRNLVEFLGMTMPLVEPERYVAKIANALSIDERTTRQAYSILRKAKRNGLVAGMDPKGLASGALYLAGLPVEGHPTQESLAKAAGVTSYTLRKRAHLLKRYVENKAPVTVVPTAAVA